MCGRYTNSASRADLAARFPELGVLADAAGTERFNVAPTDRVLTLVPAAAGAGREAALLRWGLRGRVLNARAETVGAKPAFRALVGSARGRCLVLADGWYEWLRAEDRRRPPQPVHFALPRREPFAFAGLWRDGECAIVTTRANALAAPVHDRMPVVLADEETRAAWLDPRLDADGVRPLLAPLDDGRLTVRAVDARVNAVRNDGPELLRAPEPALSLF